MSIQQVAPKPNVTDGVLIECRDVRKTFMLRGHEVHAVKCVNLSIRRGETLLIRGESGAGKSTLLGLLAVLEMPSTGTMTVDGASVDLMQGAALLAWRRRVGFIFQAHNLLLGWTAEENVTAGLMGMGLWQNRAARAGPAGPRSCRTRQSLGSPSRRIEHGRAAACSRSPGVVRQPAFIVADEPTADVDETSAQLIIKQLLEAARQPDVTLIVATHGNVRPEFTGRVFAMKSGTLIPDGSVS